MTNETLEHLLTLAAGSAGLFLSGMPCDARKREAFDAAYVPGEIGHFTTFPDDDDYIDALIQPYTCPGLPDVFAIEWPESVYADRLLFTSEHDAMTHLFRGAEA